MKVSRGRILRTGVAVIMAMGFTATASYGQMSRGDRYSGATWATRSPVLAQHGMAATEQPLASQIAIDIMKRIGGYFVSGFTF